MSFGNFVKSALPVIGGAVAGPAGALVGGLGSTALNSFGGSSSGGGSAGNMGGMAKAYVARPIPSLFGDKDDANEFLEKFRDNELGGLRRDDALDIAFNNLSPFGRMDLLKNSSAARDIVGFQYDSGERRKLGSTFSDAAFGGYSATPGFVDQVSAQAEALGANTPEEIQRLAFNAAARSPRGQKMFATGPQTQMEAQFGQLLRDGDGTLTGKYDVGRDMENLISRRIASA